MIQRRTTKTTDRRGAAAVEFALMAPVFIVVLAGLVKAGRVYELHGQLQMAAREGARLASMDREGLLTNGQSTNDKMEQDIRGFLNAHGMPGDEVSIHIAEVDADGDGEIDGGADDPEAPLVTFDVDNDDNNLRYFQVYVAMSQDHLGGIGIPGLDGYQLGAQFVFRNARAAFVE